MTRHSHTKCKRDSEETFTSKQEATVGCLSSYGTLEAGIAASSTHCEVSAGDCLLSDRCCAGCCITVIDKTPEEPACYSLTDLIEYGFWNKEKTAYKRKTF